MVTPVTIDFVVVVVALPALQVLTPLTVVSEEEKVGAVPVVIIKTPAVKLTDIGVVPAVKVASVNTV